MGELCRTKGLRDGASRAVPVADEEACDDEELDEELDDM